MGLASLRGRKKALEGDKELVEKCEAGEVGRGQTTWESQGPPVALDACPGSNRSLWRGK